MVCGKFMGLTLYFELRHYFMENNNFPPCWFNCFLKQQDIVESLIYKEGNEEWRKQLDFFSRYSGCVICTVFICCFLVGTNII